MRLLNQIIDGLDGVKRTRVYISGPMRGYPSFNFPAFDAAAALLEPAGFVVFNPAAHDRETYPDIESWPGFATGDTEKCPKFVLPDSLRWDFARIMESDMVLMLPGWERSHGARAERYLAECVGVPVWLLHTDGRRPSWSLDPQPRLATPALLPRMEVLP